MTESKDYRQQVRETMQAFSDEALAYQDRIIVGGIDREECDIEIQRRKRRRQGSYTKGQPFGMPSVLAEAIEESNWR